jgi:Protease inhibitor Inh
MSRNEDMHPIGPAFRASAVLASLVVAAGCTGERFGGDGPGPAAVARPAAPPVNMAGRWMLASPGRGQCNMTFGAASPTAAEGTIAPEGGCPGQFYTSRKWTFDSTGLVIRNHKSEPLAQLSAAGGARFDGQATSGDAVTLTR